MNRFLPLLASLVFCGVARAQMPEPAPWTAILQKYVTPQSRVNYAQLKTDGVADLDRYLTEVAAPWPKTAEPEAVKAALINAYNALTVRWMVTNFPVKSIWRTKVPFRVARHKIDGGMASLDDIETRLRNMGDPRIHGALVCAARSCPPLRREAYTASMVNQQLDDNVRAWLADDMRNRFQPEKKAAKVSKIFDWYKDDFAKVGGVPAFLEKFAPAGRFAAANKLDYQGYNWGLNDTGSVGDSYSGFEFYIDYARNSHP